MDFYTGTGDDIISTAAFAYNDSIWSGDGDDTINVGKGGRDYVIQDFTQGAGLSDVVRFYYSPFANMSLATIKNNMQQVGSDVVLTLSDTDSITLVGATISGFVADDFYW